VAGDETLYGVFVIGQPELGEEACEVVHGLVHG